MEAPNIEQYSNVFLKGVNKVLVHEYCVNVDSRIDALSTKCVQFGIKPLLNNKYEASSMTLCPKLGQHYKMCCIDRECKDCGTSQLKTQLQLLLEEIK